MNLDEFKDILQNKQSFLFISLVKPNGLPHVTPVWFDMDADDFLSNTLNINIATGRIKSKFLKKGSHVALAIMDPDDSYRHIGLDGVIDEIITGEKIANDHKNKLTKKYLGLDLFPFHKETEKRIKVRIKLTKQYASKPRVGKN
jgi:hypothetical protein